MSLWSVWVTWRGTLSEGVSFAWAGSGQNIARGAMMTSKMAARPRVQRERVFVIAISCSGLDFFHQIGAFHQPVTQDGTEQVQGLQDAAVVEVIMDGDAASFRPDQAAVAQDFEVARGCGLG